MIEIKKLSELDTSIEYYNMISCIEPEHSYMHGLGGKPYEIFPRWLAHRVSIATGSTRAFSTYWFLNDGKPIGLGCFHHELSDDLRKSGGNIVYCIAPQYRGRGYGKEAVRLLVEAMKDFGIAEILFMIEKDNIPSLCCAKSCGAKLTGETETDYFLTIRTA